HSALGLATRKLATHRVHHPISGISSPDTRYGGCESLQANFEYCIMDENHLIPHVFTRHKLNLHALLLENQAWFSARDLGRLLRLFLDERALRKLDSDQR